MQNETTTAPVQFEARQWQPYEWGVYDIESGVRIGPIYAHYAHLGVR